MRHHAIIFSFLIVVNFVSLIWAQNLTGTVLYPIIPPAGYSTQIILSSDGGQVVGYTATSYNGNAYDHALLWSSPSGAVSILDPTGYIDAEATFTNGIKQVGYGFSPTTQGAHALLWSGTPGSVIDLNPTQLDVHGAPAESFAEGFDGNQVVGYAGFNANLFNTNLHATLWNGSAASAVDLNPSGFPNLIGTWALGTDDAQQAGVAYFIVNKESMAHAMLWSGSAASAVDLNPSALGFFYSKALSVTNGQQVGYGETTSFHALLWTGTATSAVDLDPTNLPGFINSYALSTNGTQQVGYGTGITGDHALLWSGTAASAVNLQVLLPAEGTWTNSYAEAIDADGNVYGYARGTFDNVTGTFAVEWAAVPEPIGLSALCLAGLIWPMQKRRPCVRAIT